MDQSETPPQTQALETSPNSLPRRDVHLNADASPRRKRQRTSDDEDSPSHGNCDLASTATLPVSLLPERSPEIEVQLVDAEDHSDTTIINMDTDLLGIGDVADHFPFISKKLPTAEDAAGAWNSHISDRDNTLTDDQIELFATWLDTTLKYPDTSFVGRSQFWTHIGSAINALSIRSTLGNELKTREGRAQQLFGRLFSAYSSLCAKLMQIERQEMDRTSARRDSVKSEDCPAYSTRFITCFEGLVRLFADCGLWRAFDFQRGFDSDALRRDAADLFVKRSDSLADMVALFEDIAERPDQVNAAFAFLSCQLQLAFSLFQAGRPGVLLQPPKVRQNLNRIFHISNSIIIPKLAKLKVEISFHRRFLDTLTKYLELLAQVDNELVQGLYSRLVDSVFVSSDIQEHDVCSPSLQDGVLQEQLQRFATACVCVGWRVQTAMALLSSPMTELRVLAVESLSRTLMESHSVYEGTPEKATHPVMRYLAKVLMTRNFIRVMLSSDSHADVLRRSVHTIGFLCITGCYSHTDSDFIWDTIVRSNKADFQEAAVTIWTKNLQHMSLHEALHILHKFNSIQLQHLGKHILSVVSELVKFLRQQAIRTKKSEIQYETALVIIRLLQRIAFGPRKPDIEQAHKICLIALASMIGPSIGELHLQQLIEVCLLGLDDSSLGAIGSVEALLALCENSVKPTLQAVVSLIPLQSIVKDLFQYVQKAKQQPSATFAPYELEPRVRLVLLQFLAKDDLKFEEQVWEHLVGVEAINNAARDLALLTITELAQERADLKPFFYRCITQHLPNLPFEAITPGLIPFYTHAVNLYQNTEASEFPGALLQDQIADFVLVAPQDDLSRPLANILVQCLFHGAALKQPDTAVPAQFAIVNKFIQILQKQDSRAARSIWLLIRLVDESREYEHATLAKTSIIERTTVMADNTDASQSIKIPVEAHGWPGCITKLNILVKSETTLGEIRAIVVRETGYQAFSVFAGGQKVDLETEPDLTVRGTNLPEKGQLLIRQTHSTESILVNRTNEISGTFVEQQIVKKFDHLYTYLSREDELGRAVRLTIP